MKLKVNQNVCIGCGACQAICPNAFEIDDNGYATTIVDEISEEEIKDSQKLADSMGIFLRVRNKN